MPEQMKLTDFWEYSPLPHPDSHRGYAPTIR